MDEQKRTDPQEQEQERKPGDLEVPDEQGDTAKGPSAVDPEVDPDVKEAVAPDDEEGLYR